MSYTVKILDIQAVTHDAMQYKVEKPKGYFFIPGQATEVAINKEKWVRGAGCETRGCYF